MKKIYKEEKGITLVALIITIIILVILAAVSIQAAYNSGIIDYSVNGTQKYIEEAKIEEERLENANDIFVSAITRIESVINAQSSGIDESTILLAAIEGEYYYSVYTTEIVTGAKPLGPSLTEQAIYYSYNGIVYKATWDGDAVITTVTKTSIDPSTLGLKGTNFVTVNGTYSEEDFEVDEYDPVFEDPRPDYYLLVYLDAEEEMAYYEDGEFVFDQPIGEFY